MLCFFPKFKNPNELMKKIDRGLMGKVNLMRRQKIKKCVCQANCQCPIYWTELVCMCVCVMRDALRMCVMRCVWVAYGLYVHNRAKVYRL